MKPDKNLLISMTKGTDTKEEYTAYQLEKQKNSDDLKIDLTTSIMDRENFHGAKNVKDNFKVSNYSGLDFDKLTRQDILVTQVPNLNEAGFFAGLATLISYIRTNRKDIKIKGIDPCTEYFFQRKLDLKSQFFADFNTYSAQGSVNLDKYKELDSIVKLFQKYIDKCKPTYFGFGLIDGNIDASLFFAKKIKKLYPDLKIMLGGCGVSLMGKGKPEYGGYSMSVASNQCYDITEYDYIDYIINGDGEKTLIELFDSSKLRKDLEKIDGLVWKHSEDLSDTEQQIKTILDDLDKIDITKKEFNYSKDVLNRVFEKELSEDLDIPDEWTMNPKRQYTDLTSLAAPDYNDFYENPYYKKFYNIAVPLTFSRGCNFRCTFCSVPVFVPLYKHRPIEQCLDEIGYWVDKNFEEGLKRDKYYRVGMLAHDSILNGNPKWLEDLCKGIIKRGYGDKITWGGNLRLMKPMADINTMKLYRDAGIEFMITGAESFSEPVLKHMKKNKNMKIVRKIFENIREINKEAGDRYNDTIKVQLQLIVGYMNETEEDFQKTLDFVEEFHDVIYEILTCSVFSVWFPLKKQWEDEGRYLKYHSPVVWETEYCTTEQRMERIDRIEKLFDKLGLNYNTYHRGLMMEHYQDYLDSKRK